MKTIWNLFLHNHLFRIIILAFLFILSSILIGVFNGANVLSVFYWIQLLTAIGLGIYVLVLIIHAWIINPLKNKKKKIK